MKILSVLLKEAIQKKIINQGGSIMNKFDYRVSIIVPVYNVEQYLRDCLDSLLVQNIDHELMEVLLINDGSTDSSLDICKEYVEMYEMFKVFSKENEGLSATRNYGVKRAKGKYLMYLDSDDMLTPETVKAVTDFFDTVYEEVDLVTYKIQPYKDGKKMKAHYRYNYLKKTGVYDLNKYPYICQTNIDICVKNLLEDNFLFDTTPNFRQEDQEYVSKVLLQKQKIGYCSKGEYCYNRSNEGSFTANVFHAYYIFETSTAYFEGLAEQFGGEIPLYYQNMIFSDMIWKFNEDKLLPYHYDEKDYNIAIARIKNLLSKVDESIILRNPNLDNFQKAFWLEVKPNVSPVILANRDNFGIYIRKEKFYSRKTMEIIMHKIRIVNKQVTMRAFVKSPIYNFLKEKAKVFVIENDNFEEKRVLNVTESIHSYYKAKEKDCYFWLFTYHCDTFKVKKVKFVVEIDGIIFNTAFWCMPVAVFNESLGIDSYVRDNVKITLDNQELYFQQLTEEETYNFEVDQNLKFIQNSKAYNLRKSALNYRKKHRIWLYYDLYTVKKDNGYFQFINDTNHNDGIERYYVYDCELSEIESLFSDFQKQYLIKFGTEKHKLLYLSAEKVLTAFFGFTPISPFRTEKEEGNYLDIIKFRTIYLQHGVLHANLRLSNHAERSRADQIVVSSYFEKNNYVKNYGYEESEIITTGMARYDYIDKTCQPKNRILFAPSWRKYLTNEITSSKWEMLEEKILTSDYYKKFEMFLKSEQLLNMLELENLYLDFKLHPIIKDAKNLFNFDNKRISIVSDEVKVEDYKLFITDFSSYVFDFGYLSRPIMYFVPDMLQFKAGMNHYRELDLPWEEAFGKLVLEAEDAVTEVIRIISNNFIPDPIFKERMDNFYVPLSNCAEKLYQYLMDDSN